MECLSQGGLLVGRSRVPLTLKHSAQHGIEANRPSALQSAEDGRLHGWRGEDLHLPGFRVEFQQVEAVSNHRWRISHSDGSLEAAIGILYGQPVSRERLPHNWITGCLIEILQQRDRRALNRRCVPAGGLQEQAVYANCQLSCPDAHMPHQRPFSCPLNSQLRTRNGQQGLTGELSSRRR